MFGKQTRCQKWACAPHLLCLTPQHYRGVVLSPVHFQEYAIKILTMLPMGFTEFALSLLKNCRLSVMANL